MNCRTKRGNHRNKYIENYNNNSLRQYIILQNEQNTAPPLQQQQIGPQYNNNQQDKFFGHLDQFSSFKILVCNF